MKRVVITGQGTVNALGQTAAQTRAAFAAARCGIGLLAFRDVERLSVKIGAQQRDFRPEQYFDCRQTSRFDRFTQFAMVAAREAVAQSGLTFKGDLATRTGVILGTAGGGVSTWDDSYRAVYEQGKNRVPPVTVPRLMNNAAASYLAIEHGLQGPNYTVSSACASSNQAMGQAFHMVRAGLSPVMVTGGAESMLCFGGLKAWEGLRVMSPDACRPFSRDRNGMVQGEGAAIFVLEELEHARARGADILAEVVGFAMTSDASDIVMPSQLGAERAIAGALRDARLAPDDVGYINAHGTGTIVNDRTECAAVRQVFGAAADNLRISSTKSMHGHAIGATGAIEMIACVMALREGVIAPTIGYRVPDPDCALDVVANEAREAKIDVVLSNAFAFGGLNAVLVLRKFSRTASP